METYDSIVGRYTCARLDGDQAATTAILKFAIEHDKANPDKPPLMAHLEQAANRTPARIFKD